jgi:pilus assembly protein CpaD
MKRTPRTFEAVACERRIGARLTMVIIAVSALAGCKTIETPETMAYTYDYRERHPISIHEGIRTVELFIGSHRAGLTPIQRADVDYLAQGWHSDAAGGVEIRVPARTSNERAARDTVPEIRAILVAGGVPARNIAVLPSYQTDANQFLPIVIAYPRVVASAGPCGIWPNDLGPGAGLDYATNTPYWNQGCATQRNLAAMVENPADLVQPRGETPASMQRRSVVLEKYRKGEDTASQHPDTEKSKLSDTGK